MILSFLALLLPSSLPAAAGGDSLAYAARKAEIRAHPGFPAEYEAYFAASDEFAAKGRYDEAMSLLEDLFAGFLSDTSAEAGDTTSPQARRADSAGGVASAKQALSAAAAPRKHKNVSWRLSEGLSYDVLGDENLSSTHGTPGAVDSLLPDSLFQALDEYNNRPWNAFARIEYDWRPQLGALTELSPYCYLSTSRARLGLTGDGEPANGYVTYNGSLEGELKIGEEYGDSSDVLRGECEISLNTEPLDWIVSGALPVRLDGEWYRCERPEYNSYAQGTVTPQVCVEAHDFSRKALVTWEYTYLRYVSADSADIESRYGPHLSLEWWAEHFSGTSDLSYVWATFPCRKDPRTSQVASGEAQVSLKPVSWLEARVDASALWERDGYVHQQLLRELGSAPGATSISDSTPLQPTIYTSYGLLGYGGKAVPGLQVTLRNGVKALAEVGYEEYLYPQKGTVDTVKLADPLYMEESYTAWEPRVGAGLETAALDASVSCAYRIEHIIDPHYLQDSRSLKPAGDVNWRISQSISLDLCGEWEHRMYVTGEPADNISAALTVGDRF